MLKGVFWSLAVLVFPLFALVTIWMTLSSAYFLRVHDMTYDPVTKTVTMTRTVLSRSDQIARWNMNVTVPGGRECSDSGQDIYEPFTADGEEKNVATFPAGDLAECLEHPEAQIVAYWQVMYWGVVPLKPTYFFKPPRS